MRKTLIFLATLLFAGHQALGATYYVSPSGSNTSPYDTWEKAANLPSTVVGDLVTAGNVTFTRTSWPDIADYHLLRSSPAINAGVNVGLTTDFAGNPVPMGVSTGSGVDIGAYEYDPRTASTSRRFPSFLSFPSFPGGTGAAAYDNTWDGLTFYAPFDDPADPLKLNRGTGSLSFTRATTAAYVHPTTGLITSAASGQLRIEANGALIEGQRTNLAIYSDADAVGGYTPSGDITVAPYSWPCGFLLNAVTFADNGATRFAYHQANMDNGATYVFSAYVKMDDNSTPVVGSTSNEPDKDFTIIIDSNTVPSTNATVNPIGGGVYKIASYVVADIGGASRNTGIVKYTGNSTKGFKASGYQLEAASFPSSYIPTAAAAVTRNLDRLTVATSGNMDNTTGTIAFGWTPAFGSTDSVGTATMFDATNITGYYESVTRQMAFRDIYNTGGSAPMTFSSGDTSKWAFRWSESASNIGSTLSIGSSDTSTNPLFGHLKPIRIWNRSFSDSEMGIISQ